MEDEENQSTGKRVESMKATLQNKSRAIAEQITSNIGKSKDGVMHMKQVVFDQGKQQFDYYWPKWDRETILRFCTPFAILFLWLIFGMLLFYVIESPAELYRQRLAAVTKNIQNKAKIASGEDMDNSAIIVSRFGEHVEEQTFIIDLTAGPLVEEPEIRNETKSSNSTEDNSYLNYNAQLIRSFNKLFFYSAKEIDVVAVKAGRPVVSDEGQSRQLLTLTVFFTNRTKVKLTRSAENPGVETPFDQCGDLNGQDTGKKENLKWDLPGSLFFCLAVVTTIGYGNLSPATNFGKFICVFYAMIGIPLFLVVVAQMRGVLTRYACKLHKLFYWLARFFQRQSTTIIERSAEIAPNIVKTSGNKIQRSASASERHEESLRRAEIRVATSVVAIFGCCLFIFLPSIFFVHAEGWEYLSALYFSFISLTTIGFGDLIAGQRSGGTSGFSYGLYRLFLCVWLFFGIAFVATLIQIMQTLIERLIERIHWKRRVATRKKTRSVRQAGDQTLPETPASDLDEEAPKTINLLEIIDTGLLNDKGGKNKNGKDQHVRSAASSSSSNKD